MEKKITDTVKNIMTIGGAIAMACVLLDEISDKDEFEKLTSGKDMDKLQLLTAGEEKKEADTSEHDAESKKKDDEISELKKKLAELESKSGDQSQQ